jgi:peptide/nickel transport system permease protein
LGNLESYILLRLVFAVPFVLIIIILSFLLIHAAPGDPAYMLAGQSGEVSRDYIEMIRKEFGLDKPILEQLWIYLGNTLRGDLGYSFAGGQQTPVLNIILQRVPATALLMITSYIISISLGILLGVLASRKPFSAFDNVITLSSLIGFSLPVQWVGLMMVLVFSVFLNWFPTGGMMSLRFDLSGISYVADVLWHLLLPAFTLAIIDSALIARLTRSGMLEVLREDYIVTARAKGLHENTVFFKHALRNAILPVVTVAGVNISLMLAGVVVTETVFSWPGLGRLMYDSIYFRDYPVILGLFVFISIFVIITNLVVDILYSWIDPRIRGR